MKTPMHLALAFCLTSALAACGDDGEGDSDGGEVADSGVDCSAEARADEFAPGMSKTGGAGYAFVLTQSLPAPPDKGNNAWTLEVSDAGGAPADDLTLEIDPFMPDHGHGSTVAATVTPAGDGVYEIDPVNLFMAGYWEITIVARDAADATVDSAVFKFCVEG